LKGNPSIQSAAELLAISPRTIQRRLRSQGLSFREVVQQIRVELMTELLSSEAPSRARMKSILGYSSERSVDRAYHRWTAQRACGGVGR
jgi:transcriptional regulator GlxA family with amidase domain